MLRTIIRLNLTRVEKRVKENHKVPFTFDDAVPDLIANPLHRAGAAAPAWWNR